MPRKKTTPNAEPAPPTAPTITLEDGTTIEAEAGTVPNQWRVYSADRTQVYHHCSEAEDGTWLYRFEETVRPPTMADPFA